MSISPTAWRVYIVAAAAVGAAAATTVLVRWARQTPDPEAPERFRRSRLSQFGRIVEGQILELVEAPASPPPPPRFSLFRKGAPAPPNDHRTLVCYCYSISGVSYETAQDITGLEERAALHRVAAGQPASIKYDPSNPGNSILIADDWSGLR